MRDGALPRPLEACARGAETPRTELGSSGVRRHAAGVCQGGAAAPGGGAGLGSRASEHLELCVDDAAWLMSAEGGADLVIGRLSETGACNASFRIS